MLEATMNHSIQRLYRNKGVCVIPPKKERERERSLGEGGRRVSAPGTGAKHTGW